MSKTTTTLLSLSEIMKKIERTLDAEIESLPETLSQVTPEKRLDFVGKILPVVIKYRDGDSCDWSVPEWR